MPLGASVAGWALVIGGSPSRLHGRGVCSIGRSSPVAATPGDGPAALGRRRWRSGSTGSLVPMSIDVTDATFQTDVLDRSPRPCPSSSTCGRRGAARAARSGRSSRRSIDETDGKVVLAKVNVDENPQVSARRSRCRASPRCTRSTSGKVVDGFVGAQPEAHGAGVRRPAAARARPTSRSPPCWRRATRRRCARCSTERPDHHDAIVALAELLADRRPTRRRRRGAWRCSGRIPETAETRRVAALVRTGAQPTAATSGDEITAKLDALLDQVKADDEARQEYIDLLEVLAPTTPARPTTASA